VINGKASDAALPGRKTGPHLLAIFSIEEQHVKN
jgi:hypothetical protein